MTPRRWFRLDVLFPQEPAIEELRDEFGPAGPWLFLVLLADAYNRWQLGEPGGVVNIRAKTLASRVGVGVDDTSAIVRALVRLGLVKLAQGSGTTVKGTLPKWRNWTPDDTTGADRMAEHRARQTAEAAEAVARTRNREGAVTSGDAEKRREDKITDEHVRLCRLLADLILARDGKAKVEPDSPRWLNACRLLIDRDDRTPSEVEHVIRWCQADEFWRSNILSMAKLRDKFDLLIARAGRPRSAGIAGFDERMGLPR